MTSVELVSTAAALLSLAIGALSALAAFRSAASARAAQHSAEEGTRRGALFSASRTAAEVVVEAQRIAWTAQQAGIAYDTLSVFSGSYQNSGVQESKAKVLALAAKAEEHAGYARLFGDAGTKLRDAPLEEIDRVQLKLAASQAEVSAVREELVRIAASVEAQNTQYRERALAGR